jgi:hypothetical protein
MNQMVSATHTNITPAKLEEFEATFKHFDKDDTNVRPLPCTKLMIDVVDLGNAFCPGEFGDCICGKSSPVTMDLADWQRMKRLI